MPILVEVQLSLIYQDCNMDDALANVRITDPDLHVPEQLIRDLGMLDLSILMIDQDISIQDTEKPRCMTNQIVINTGLLTKIENITMILDITIRMIVINIITIDIVIIDSKINKRIVIVFTIIIIIIQEV